jgi:hypothetical protein
MLSAGRKGGAIMLNRSLSSFAAAILLLGTPPLLAAADAVPRLNIEATCRIKPDPTIGAQRDASTCLKSENDARDKLASEWNGFPVADRGLCTQTATMGGTASYVELLTCLEMRRDARTLPRDELTRLRKQP